MGPLGMSLQQILTNEGLPTNFAMIGSHTSMARFMTFAFVLAEEPLWAIDNGQ